MTLLISGLAFHLIHVLLRGRALAEARAGARKWARTGNSKQLGDRRESGKARARARATPERPHLQMVQCIAETNSACKATKPIPKENAAI